MFIDKINDLKIKYKLMLLVLLPMILLVVMAAGMMIDMRARLNEARSSYAHQQMSLMLADFVHELQLERGISAGYVGSGGKRFAEELRAQRTRVDDRNHVSRNLVETRWFGNDPGHSQAHYEELQKAFDEREAFRSAVDARVRASGFFQYYSDLIAGALHFAQHLSTAVNDALLARKLEAYSTLLWLQEYAGQERGALNSVFASGRVDVRTIQMIEGYVAKQDSMLRRFRQVAATREQRRLLDGKLSDPAVTRVRAMRRAALSKGVKSDLLNSLQTLIGYGGLIHDFKNYVIRRTPEYRERFNAYFNEAEEIVREYGQLSGRSEEELHDLDTIIATFRRYQKFLGTVEGIRLDATSVKEIDKVVKVDDGPALAAIKRLRENVAGMDSEEWFRHSTRRIALIKEVGDAIGRDITRYAERTMGETRLQLVSHGLLMAVALAAILFITVLITRRLVGGVTGVTQALERVKETGDFAGHISEQGGDEIAAMARSFNLLITERSRIEETLCRSREYLETAWEEAESANQAKSEFLARMSHDLRTPLNAILGFAQILEYDEALSPEQMEQVKEIHKAGHHLLALINEVLDLAKIEAGCIDLHIQPVALDDTLQECIGLILPAAQQSGVDLRDHGADKPDVMLYADPTRLKEVVLNLLSNAVKYNREGGTVTLVSESVAENRLRIKVSDTGPGLSARQQKLLFRPFERLGADNTQVEGTGIGLVISKRMIEMMGGAIGVESVPGKGSTFWVELNCFERAEQAELTQEQSADRKLKIDVPDGERYTILYVEDNPVSLRVVEEILKDYPGLDLRAALTPEKGLELAAADKLDLILLDIDLPGMNGTDLLGRIRDLKAHKKTPTVAVSANAMPRDIERAVNAGFADYITKPIDVSHFLCVLQRLLVPSPAEPAAGKPPN